MHSDIEKEINIYVKKLDAPLRILEYNMIGYN